MKQKKKKKTSKEQQRSVFLLKGIIFGKRVDRMTEGRRN